MLNPIHIQSFDYVHFVFWMPQEGLAFLTWLQEIVFARAPPLSDSIADPRIVTLSRHVKNNSFN